MPIFSSNTEAIETKDIYKTNNVAFEFILSLDTV